MPDYSKAKIYKITSNGEIYYGSTLQPLHKRHFDHKKSYYQYQRGERTFITSFTLFEKYGVDNCRIELVEEYECKSIEELHRREGWWITNNPCVNKQIAGRTRKEYYNDNKDMYLEKAKKFSENNREKVREYKKKYADKNKDKKSEKGRERINCDICQKEVCRRSLTRHKKLIHNKA